MVLLLYVNEAGHATRVTQRPSFFVRMRFGEEGESGFVFHSANFASRHERTRCTPLAQTGGLHKAAIVWGSRCPSCHANSICHREQMGGEEQALGGEKKREEGGWLNAELTFEFAAALCTICICLYHVQGRLHSFFKWKLA
ncbi:uncharacterized [Tachysurus ichikawai]